MHETTIALYFLVSPKSHVILPNFLEMDIWTNTIICLCLLGLKEIFVLSDLQQNYGCLSNQSFYVYVLLDLSLAYL